MQNPTPLPPIQPNHRSGLSKTVWVVIALILVCALLPHVIFPLLGIAFVLTAAALGIAVVSIALLAIALILFLIFPGSLIFVVGMFALVWVVLAIVLFPVLFPIIMPIFIILLFIGYLKRRNKNLNK
jgi:hypothetical protein